MRSVTLVLALAAICAASPALAQARILMVQDETQPLRPPPRLGPPPATVPAPPQRAQNIEGAPQPMPPPEPPQQAQVQPPPLMSARPKTQERVEIKPPPPPPAVGRYSFNRVDDGFLRLDKATGQIAYCSPHTAGWGCQAVPENRVALEKEVARLREQVASLKKLQDDVASLKMLRDEVAALKKEIAALRPPPPPRPPALVPPPAAKPDKDSTSKQPGDRDLVGARAYIDYTWRRLVDMISQFQKDMMGRRESGSANGLSRT